MKKQISLFLTFVFVVTACVFPISAFASTQVVKINGQDKLQVTNVIEAFDVPAEGVDNQSEFVCGLDATLTILEDNAIALVFHTIHDPENGSSSNNVIPDGYTYSDLNEYGQVFDMPKGSTFTFTERGMYYYDIQFADNTYAVGYIEVMDGYVPVAPEEPVIPETPAAPETPDRSEAPAKPEAPQVPEMPECGYVTVVSKAQRIQIEESWADVNAYNIFDNNYIKLRDFAFYYSMFCSFTDKCFDVTWDGEKNAINLVRGMSYQPDGTEGGVNTDVYADAVLSSAQVYLDGEYIPLTAFNINGNNYFKLRDLCEALDISISWWGVQQIIYINNDYNYGTEFEEIVPDVMW